MDVWKLEQGRASQKTNPLEKLQKHLKQGLLHWERSKWVPAGATPFPELCIGEPLPLRETKIMQHPSSPQPCELWESNCREEPARLKMAEQLKQLLKQGMTDTDIFLQFWLTFSALFAPTPSCPLPQSSLAPYTFLPKCFSPCIPAPYTCHSI